MKNQTGFTALIQGHGANISKFLILNICAFSKLYTETY